ncbi:hypothetical protein DV515_00015705 [Chloebia gouldiae]|uniref:Rab-like protein 2B n=1 Tax=Chloebia gouldiae TaxID=44316 RepID=A0A3L8RUF5_CHLGU|nr:hypothetical protein DV515_00015705 [Chloebia gouldiae]
MATAAEQQGRAAAPEEAPDGARDEAAAGAEETVKIICLGDSAVGKSKCVGRGRPAGSGGGPAVPGGRRVPRLTAARVSLQAAGAVPARWLVSLAAGERGSGAGAAAGPRVAAERAPRLSVRSLTRRSRPQQLSTFALTLYQHRARVGGQEVRVGEWGQPGDMRCHGRGNSWEVQIPRSGSRLCVLIDSGILTKLVPFWDGLQRWWMGQDFWDTAGQERFRSMHASYYHQAHACIMVFDVQRKVTYKNLNSWYKELREFRPEIPCIVVANKIDADMKVTQKSFNFARKFSLPFYFVSAADGTNVVKKPNAHVPHPVSDRPCASHQLFNDAIRLAVAYKQHSGDFMDEVLRELESFDLQNTSKDLSNKEKSCTEEEPSSA